MKFGHKNSESKTTLTTSGWAETLIAAFVIVAIVYLLFF